MDLLFVTFIVIVVVMLSYVAWEDIGAMLKSNMYKTSKNKVGINYTQVSGQGSVDPWKAHKEDAGADLVSTSVEEKEINGKKAFVYSLGIAVEIPEGYVGLIFPRSSICKTGAVLANSVGVIDSNYRGELKAVFYADSQPYTVGDRCCQLIILPYPMASYYKVDSLSETNRGEGGFGSTGK